MQNPILAAARDNNFLINDESQITKAGLSHLIDITLNELDFNNDPIVVNGIDGGNRRIKLMHICILGRKAGIDVPYVVPNTYSKLLDYICNHHVRNTVTGSLPLQPKINRNWKKIDKTQGLYVCLDLLNVATAVRDRNFIKSQIVEHRGYFELENGINGEEHEINIHIMDALIYDSGAPMNP
jgi:hypothetical protein